MLWLGLAFVILLCVIFTAFEKWTWTTLCLLASGGLYFWVNKALVLSWIVENWQTALCFAGAYLIAGVVWSFGKWFFFLIGFRDAYRERKSWFLKKRGLDPDAQIPESLSHDFSEFLRTGYITVIDRGTTMQETYSYGLRDRHYYGGTWNMRPRASDHKSRITGWIGFWPFSMVGTVINDPLRKLIDFLFASFKGLYQKMSDALFRNEPGLK
jgi:hypothetical protein